MRSIVRISFSRPYSSEKGNLVRRLQQLKDENSVQKDDPLVRLASGIVDNNEDLKRIHQRLPQSEFVQKFNDKIQYSKIGEHVNKQSKDIAMSTPWRGEGSHKDASLRMILDTVKRPVGNSSIANNLGFSARTEINHVTPRAVKASIRRRDRLENAQDSVLDYKMDKTNPTARKRVPRNSDYTRNDSSNLMILMKSVADVKIEESMKRGDFDSLKGLRGKNIQPSQPKPHVDRTEHHLNDILVRQNIAPPWIDRQGRINREVDEFREELKKSFEVELIHALEGLKLFSHSDDTKSLSSALVGIEKKHQDIERLKSLAFNRWKEFKKKSIDTKINILNSGLRSYNLQAPLHTQKLYLLPEREIQRAFDNTGVEDVFLREVALRREKKLHDGTHEPDKTTGFTLGRIFKFW